MAINHTGKKKLPKRQVITSSGNFTVPGGVTQIYVTLAGGGGGGAGSDTDATSNGAGGGGGQLWQRYPLFVTPGEVVAVTIGAGGAGSNSAASVSDSSNGSPSLFGSYLYASGGIAGKIGVFNGVARLGSGAGGGASTVTPSIPGLGAYLEGTATSGTNGGGGGSYGHGALTGGPAAANSGGGGSGGANSSVDGSAGGSGICIVEWEL